MFKSLKIQGSFVLLYLYRMCIDKRRTQLVKKTKDISNTFLAEHINAPTLELFHKEQYEETYLYCLNCMEQLSVPKKEILQLVIAGFSTKEVAHVLGYKEDYIRKMKYEAKKELIEKLYDNIGYNKII